jgi:linoleate 10R-lipoxygenase
VSNQLSTLILFSHCICRFFLASDDPARAEKERKEVVGALAGTPEASKHIGQFFHDKTRELIGIHSYKLVGGKVNAVDIVRDVLNVVPLHWAAAELAS